MIRTNSNQYRSFDYLDRPQVNDPMDKVDLGLSLKDVWSPISVTLYEDKDQTQNDKITANFMWFLGITVDKKAKNILAPLIDHSVEFLPLITSVGEYWVINISVIDCLNVNDSVVRKFKEGRIMDVTKYAFYEEKIKNVHIFLIPELLSISVFVSDEFKQIYEENGLTGLLFSPVEYT